MRKVATDNSAILFRFACSVHLRSLEQNNEINNNYFAQQQTEDFKK